MRYLFIINPTAGKGTVQQAITENINDCFKGRENECDIRFTAFRGEAGKIAEKEAQKGDSLRIFACGGEGTVFEILNGIVGYDNVELGVIPCGSANDFLKFFGQKDRFLDIKAQIDGKAIPVDIIKAGEYYCLNSCSVGMDAFVARDMSIFKKWPLVSGSMAYNLAIVKTILKRKLGITAELSVNGGEKKTHNCLFTVVSNAPYYGGGFISAPDAVPYDGELDLTVVNMIFRLRIPGFISYYKNGRQGELDFCKLSRCDSLEFWTENPIPVNLDGEVVESNNMRFEIIRGGIKFVLPEGMSVQILKNDE